MQANVDSSGVRRYRSRPLEPVFKIAALDNLRAGGARNPHLHSSKLRFLRSGDTQILIARYILKTGS
jgi:hypothetical protein